MVVALLLMCAQSGRWTHTHLQPIVVLVINDAQVLVENVVLVNDALYRCL
jgi:hypothetical protein